MKRISVIIGILSQILFVYPRLYAGIGVSPIRVEIAAEIGKETVGTFAVTNTGEKSTNVSIDFEDWLGLGVDPNTWIRFEAEKFSLEPKETKEVKYVINVPKDRTGELAIRMFFNGKEEGAMVGTGIGVHLYALIKGTERIDAEIKELNAEITPEKDIKGWLVIENKGNVHIRPNTVISVLNTEGDVVSNFSVPYDIPVQAGKTNRYSFSNKVLTLTPGKYRVVAKSDCGRLYGIDLKIIKEVDVVIEEKPVVEEPSEETKEESPLSVGEEHKES